MMRKSAAANAAVSHITRTRNRILDTGNKDNRRVVDLESIYRRTLAECAPDVIVRTNSDASMPRNVVAIGKCAGRMLAGVEYDRAFCVVPRGYPVQDTQSRVSQAVTSKSP